LVNARHLDDRMAASETPHLLMRDLEGVVARLREITVALRIGRQAAGSGVIWGADGLVVTSAHVVASAHRARDSIQVALADGRRLLAALVAWDRQLDLALLRIGASDLPTATLGDSERHRAGELVLAVGCPFGLARAVVAGVLHAAPPLDSRSGSRWIQADLRLAPGNSGGPMADAGGRVIGVNAMIAGGLALAVPSHAVQAFVMRSTGS
jgi:serine protease Do